MRRSNCFLIFLLISFVQSSYTENDGLDYIDGGASIEQQSFLQSSNEGNLIITPPDNSEILFAAPVGAQHPNQKPQPEPQPPPYKYYHDHTVSVNSESARSYVHYRRTFN